MSYAHCKSKPVVSLAQNFLPHILYPHFGRKPEPVFRGKYKFDQSMFSSKAYSQPKPVVHLKAMSSPDIL